MEKFSEEKQKQNPKAKCSGSSMWDCGSTLYDSYELNSLKRQLDSAIANSPRSLSMPHLPERRFSHQPHHDDHAESPPLPLPPPLTSCRVMNKSFIKITRSFQKLFRFVLKSAAGNKSRVSNSFRSTVESEKYQQDRFCVVYEKSAEPVLLSTIPELPDFEIGGLSPDISNFVRKTASERFTATAIGISCA